MALHKFPSSKRLQERKQIGLGLPRCGTRGLNSCILPEVLHRVALHLQVRRDREVSPGRGDTGVTEIVANHRHVGTRLQQCDGTAMATMSLER